MIKKFIKQLKEKDLFVKQIVTANEAVIEELNQTHKNKILQLKESFEKQHELIYAMQDYKNRTSNIWNGCDIGTQTDKPDLVCKNETGVQVWNIDISVAKVSSGITKTKSVETNTVEPYEQEHKSWAIDHEQDPDKVDRLLNRLQILSQKYKELKGEYKSQIEKNEFWEQIKTKYYNLYKSWNGLLKSILYK